MVILLVPNHLQYLEKYEKCGCPTCLAKVGLCRVDVYHPEKGRFVGMVAPIKDWGVESPRVDLSTPEKASR